MPGMPGLDLLLYNLLQPIVLTFLLGALAGHIRSELKLPEGAIKLLSIYLLFPLGIAGGRELAQVEAAGLLPVIAMTVGWSSRSPASPTSSHAGWTALTSPTRRPSRRTMARRPPPPSSLR